MEITLERSRRRIVIQPSATRASDTVQTERSVKALRMRIEPRIVGMPYATSVIRAMRVSNQPP